MALLLFAINKVKIKALQPKRHYPDVIPKKVAWEKGGHFGTPPQGPPQVVYARNDVWETSAKIPYWWHATTRIWIYVLLIGWKSALSSQKHNSDLGSDTSSVWNFCARFSEVISRVNHLWGRPEMSASQATGKVATKIQTPDQKSLQISFQGRNEPHNPLLLSWYLITPANLRDTPL